jgi:hypothetical protein
VDDAVVEELPKKTSRERLRTAGWRTRNLITGATDRSGRQGNLRIAPGTGFWDLMENDGLLSGATWGTADDDAGFVRTGRVDCDAASCSGNWAAMCSCTVGAALRSGQPELED